jgi:serine protease AprX
LSVPKAAAAFVALAVPFALGAAVAHATPNAAMKLSSAAAKSPNRKVVALAQFKPGVSQEQARAIVRAHHGRITDDLPSIGGFAVKLSAGQARSLKDAKGVVNVTLNTKVKTTSVGEPRGLQTTFTQSVGANALNAQGLTGKGVGVAVIDSGITGDHPDFKNADGTSRVTNVVVNSGAVLPGDPIGHGTHVAGIIAGNSNNRPAGDQDKGAYMGVAPEADIIALKTADDLGNSTVLDVINALQFVVDYRTDLNIQVVNLSISSDTPGSYKDDPLDAAVEFAWHAGVVVVAAVGNRGNAADAAQYAPGNDPFVISVGAADEQGTANPADDTLADFSSRGVTQDGFSKPDVVAPGAHITAPLAPLGAFSIMCPNCITPDLQYFTMGGTSMAAPVVSGAAALLLQARPDLNPDQVKALLTGGSGSLNELDIQKALAGTPGAGANRGVRQNDVVYQTLVASGMDPTRASWTKASWTKASWTKASWTKASWTKASWTSKMNAPWAKATWTCGTCTLLNSTAAILTKSSWSKSSWNKSSWNKSSWSAHPQW